MKNCKFSLKRFGALARKHYTENGKLYLYMLAAVTLFIIASVWYVYVADGNPYDRNNGKDIYNNMVLHQLSSYIIVVLSCMIANITMKGFRSKESVIAYYTIPASQNEKFLFCLLNSVTLSVGFYFIILVSLSQLLPLVTPEGVFYSLPINIKYLVSGIVFINACCILANTIASRRISLNVAYMLLGASLTAFISLPVMLFRDILHRFKVPSIVYDLKSTIIVGDSSLHFPSSVLDVSDWVVFVAYSVIFYVVAYFKFKERRF